MVSGSGVGVDEPLYKLGYRCALFCCLFVPKECLMYLVLETFGVAALQMMLCIGGLFAIWAHMVGLRVPICDVERGQYAMQNFCRISLHCVC